MPSTLLTKEVDSQDQITPTRHDSVFTKYVGSLTIEPGQQSKMSLGCFGPKPAKGFSIEFNPESESSESVVTQITAIGSASHYELILHVANYGYRLIEAEVWQI